MNLGMTNGKVTKLLNSCLNTDFFLKAFAFIGFILGFAHLIHLIGFLCFDIFYDLVDTAWQNDIIGEKFMPNVSEGRLNE